MKVRMCAMNTFWKKAHTMTTGAMTISVAQR